MMREPTLRFVPHEPSDFIDRTRPLLVGTVGHIGRRAGEEGRQEAKVSAGLLAFRDGPRIVTGFEMIPVTWINEAASGYNWRRDGRASELHVLTDIFGLASTTDHEMPFGRGSIHLKRGQLVLTQRFAYDRWGWEKGRLRRWFARSTEAGRIKVERTECTVTLVATLGRDRVPTLVTIIGYGSYGVSRPSRRPSCEPSYPPYSQIGIPHPILPPDAMRPTGEPAVPAAEPAGPLAGDAMEAHGEVEPEPEPEPENACRQKPTRRIGADRHSQFIAWWVEHYPAHHEGHEYTGLALAAAKDGAAVKRLLKAFPEDKELVRVVLRAWSGERAWWAEQSCTIAGLARIAAEVAAAPAAVIFSRNGRAREIVPTTYFIPDRKP